MSWWQAVILGLVEGITEYLPVSSTGHLILTSALLGLDTPAAKEAVHSFEIVIQGGAILAVLGLYWPRVVQMISGLLGRDVNGRRLLGHLLIAFLPAALIGPILDKPIDEYLFSAGPVLAALLVGGVWMIWLDRWRARRFQGGPASSDLTRTPALTRGEGGIGDLDWRRALIIGLFQCVSMWPGTSRSMMTIAGGTILGLALPAAAEFSFLLGLPTLGSACLFKLAKNLQAAHKTGGPNLFAQLGVAPVLLGFAVATVSAALAVKWLVSFLNRHGLSAFGWYRIVLSVTLGILIVVGLVEIG